MDQGRDEFAGVWEIPARRRLPTDRDSITHEVTIGGVEVVVTVGFFPEGLPGEVFVVVEQSESDSTSRGNLNAWSRSLSQLLQYGVPLEDAVKSHKWTNFPPQGFTSNPDIPNAKSIVDYVARWLELRFVTAEGDDEEAMLVELPGGEDVADDEGGEGDSADDDRGDAVNPAP